jgi:hypothetical protein
MKPKSPCLSERDSSLALNRSISEPAKVTGKVMLAENAEDLGIFSERKNDKCVSLDSFVQRLKRRGRI